MQLKINEKEAGIARLHNHFANQVKPTIRCIQCHSIECQRRTGKMCMCGGIWKNSCEKCV